MLRTEYIDVDFNLKLKKDLQEHEIICSHCGGTGLQVDNNPFGIKEENSKIHFPHKQQTIVGCRHCYNGVQSKCLHCDKILDRGSYQCDCDEARHERLLEQYEKDLEIWNKAKKITYEQALKDCVMIYIETYDKYLMVDELEEYLEDKESEEEEFIPREKLWIYGTDVIDMSIDASDVLEDACSDLHEDAMDNISGEDIKELQLLFANITFDEKYKFLVGSSYRSKYEASTSTWQKHEFVSIYNNEIIGYLKYSVDRDSNVAWGMQIVNFTNKPNLIFAKDLKQFLIDIFDKFQFRKLKFAVYVGNPIEKSYDKVCQKYGGRIVGIYKEDDKLIDGNYYDYKVYEIMAKDYKEMRVRLN